MNIIVCVKQVIDTEHLTRIVGERSIDDPDLPRVVNPCDLVAVEEALQLKNRGIADEIILVSMGFSSTRDTLYRCLAMGADRAILLCDPAFEGSDSYATATLLVKAIGSLDYGLIFCGQKAFDTKAAQVGYYLAEMLGIPIIRGAMKVEVPSGEKVIVQRKLRGGYREVLEASLPALVAVEEGLNEPRYVSQRAIARARAKEVKEYDMKALGLSPEDVGQRGSKTEVTSLSRPRPKRIFVPDSSLPALERLVQVEAGGFKQREGSTITGIPQEVASRLVEILLGKKLLRI